MRNLILLLVLLNLGAWAFFSWVIGDLEPAQMYDGAGITLLRELDPDAPISRPNVDATGTADSPGAALAAEALSAIETVVSEQADAENGVALESQFGRCISIGPFPETPEADAAMATLAEAGFDPSRSTRELDVWDGYWVYIEQIEDMAEARTIQADLAENGLEDTQIITGSDRGNLLSLGVFSEITRAGSQAERVNRIGYEATIADNMTTTETLWLDVTLSTEQSIAIETLQAPGRISRLELLSCINAEGD